MWFVVLALVASAPVSATDGKDAVCPLLATQRQLHPASQAEDFYKWAFQRVFGPLHLGGKAPEAMLRNYLQVEWESLEGPSQPLFETLDGNLVRVNLVAFRACGGRVDELADALIATQKRFTPAPSRMHTLTHNITACLQAQGPEQVPAWRALLSQHEANGWPMAHHSEAYEKAEKPAYRVIFRDILPPTACKSVE